MLILLSLCIATRNRLSSLRQLLSELEDETTDIVELVIVDGASTDGTQEFLRSYSNTRKNIRVVFEETNTGLDQGYEKCVYQARGSYCWLLSDDDQIIHGAIKEVLALLATKRYDLVVANYEIWDKVFQKRLEAQCIPITNNTIFRPAELEELFLMTASALSFIGAVIIKKSVWMERERQQYFNTWFIHLGVIFQKTFDQEVMVVSSPLIRVRYGVASWSDKAFEIWMDYWPTIIWSFSGISESAKRLVTARSPGGSVLKNLVFRGRGVSKATAGRHVDLGSGAPRAMIELIYWLPAKLSNVIVGFLCFLTIKRRRLILYDVANSPCAARLTKFFLDRSLRD